MALPRHLMLICAAWLTSISAIAAEPEGNAFFGRIAAIETQTGGRIGVAALDTKTGRRIQYRAEERFPMCSTFKLLAVGAVLKLVDDGKENLDRFVPYTKDDILEYAPVTKEHLSEGGMALRALCEAAIEQSDNTAGNLLLKAIGGPAGLTNYARSLGDKITRLDRNEPSLNIVVPGDERDTTAPATMCNDIAWLLTRDALSQRSRGQLDRWLLGSTTGGSMIRAGVPPQWRLGDKTGRGANGATNDVAALYPEDGEPVFLVIYSVGSTASAEMRMAAIAQVARAVVEVLRPNAQK